MYPIFRQTRLALQTTTLQHIGNPSSNSTHVHPLRIRTLTSTPPAAAEQVEGPSFKETPLFQQLTANPGALLALKEFGQLMKEQGIEFSPDRPPSSMQLFRLLGNKEFRKGIQKLRDDLANAGVNVDPENAMAMLDAFKNQGTKTK